MDAVKSLLTDAGFHTGLVLGAVAALALALAIAVGRGSLRWEHLEQTEASPAAGRTLPGVADRRRRPRTGQPIVPWAGVAFGLAAVLGFAHRLSVDAAFVVGLVAIAAGGVLAAHRPPAVRMLAIVPGAVVFALSSGLPGVAWAAPTVAAVTVVGGTLAAEFDRSVARHGLAPLLVVVTVFGVYATTPDNEHSRLLLGVALPFALLGWPRPLGLLGWSPPLVSLGVAGAPLVVAVVSWSVVVDGVPRPGSVVGGLACLGIFVIEPTVRWAARRPVPPAFPAMVIVATHLAVVGVASRVAGLRTPATEALAISVAAYAVAGIVLLGLAIRRPTEATA